MSLDLHTFQLKRICGKGKEAEKGGDGAETMSTERDITDLRNLWHGRLKREKKIADIVDFSG